MWHEISYMISLPLIRNMITNIASGRSKNPELSKLKLIQMKRIVILIGLSLLIGLGGYAQKNKRTSAFMYQKNGEIDKAKEAIDEAILHEKTMHDAKTWLYRGVIYLGIATSKDPAINALDPKAAEVARESLLKAKEYDVKNDFEGELTLYNAQLNSVFYTRAADGWNAGDFNKAIENFIYSFDIAASEGRFDTMVAFNIGMSAVNAENYQVALKYLQKCVDAGFPEPGIFIHMTRAFKAVEDTTSAFQILAKGREVFPADMTLMLEEAQLYLDTKQNGKLQEAMIKAIELDPENSNYYVILGQTYDNEGNHEKALELYEQAVELGADDANVYYNIGAIYNNRGKALIDSASNLPLNKVKEYDLLNAEGIEFLKQGLPYFEKSLERNPEDVFTLAALKNLYIQLKMNDKLEEINKK